MADRKTAQTFNLDRLKTPIGSALLVTDDHGVLRALDWDDYEARMSPSGALATHRTEARAVAG